VKIHIFWDIMACSPLKLNLKPYIRTGCCEEYWDLKPRIQEETREVYIRRPFTIYAPRETKEMECLEHVSITGEKRYACNFLIGKSEGENQLKDLGKSDDKFNTGFKETEQGGVD
jgi:hypothetical protein